MEFPFCRRLQLFFVCSLIWNRYFNYLWKEKVILFIKLSDGILERTIRVVDEGNVRRFISEVYSKSRVRLNAREISRDQATANYLQENPYWRLGVLHMGPLHQAIVLCALSLARAQDSLDPSRFQQHESVTLWASCLLQIFETLQNLHERNKKELNEIAILRSDHVQECLHKCSQTQIWLLTATKLWTISWIRQNNFIVWYYNVYRVYRNKQRNVQNHVILWIFVWRKFDLYQVNSFLEKNGLFLRRVCELNYCNNGINSQIDKGTEKLDHFEGRQ